MNNVNQQFKNKSVKAKQLGTQSNTSQRLRKKNVLVSMSTCHRELSYKQCQESKGPCISTEIIQMSMLKKQDRACQLKILRH